ncbi:MAG: C39 family peptidase [Phenylobacterium sp.]|uniref:C39 family peptidase n=1 Tax=Phenylobacterium sp. TaxID=1871053 RepID=UPI00391DE31F
MRPLAYLSPALVLAALAGFSAPAAAQVALAQGGELYAVPVTSLRDIPFRTVVRQQYDYSCGSAALATLLHHHYGLPVGEAEVFQTMYAAGDQSRIRKVGFSLLDMKRYLEARGYPADGYKLTYDQLLALRAPAITIIQVKTYRHFVVIKGVRPDEVLVGDPAEGLRTYPRAEFEKVWQGVVFLIRDAAAVYNAEAEWRRNAAPLDAPMSDESLSDFTRQLPVINQITPVFSLNEVLR